MLAGEVRQWRFRGPGTQIRPGTGVDLHNDAVGLDLTPGWACPAPGTAAGTAAGTAVTLYRPGASDRPVCGGESVAIRLEGLGYLAAGPPDGAEVTVQASPAVEWLVGGVPPGVAVPVDAPLALFDTVQGDHLVCRRGSDVPVLGWAATAAAPVRLPIPPAFRPPEGVPGDVELSGAVVPVRDGDLSAGLLLLLDPGDARALGDRLAARAPGAAEQLAPEGLVAAVACRWSPAGPPSLVEVTVPPAGARLWLQGSLVADPGVCLSPVRALAWAVDADGEPVTSGPGEPGWPRTTLTWWVLLPPQPDGVLDDPGAWHLPLPVRDGEPGSTTTLTPTAVTPTAVTPTAVTPTAVTPTAVTPTAVGATAVGAAGGRTPERRGGAWAWAGVTLVPGLTGSRRSLRVVPSPATPGAPSVLGCLVRVHLPEPRPTGA